MPSRSPVSTLFRWKAASPDVSRVRPASMASFGRTPQLCNFAISPCAKSKSRYGLGSVAGGASSAGAGPGAGSPGSVSSTCIVSSWVAVARNSSFRTCGAHLLISQDLERVLWTLLHHRKHLLDLRPFQALVKQVAHRIDKPDCGSPSAQRHAKHVGDQLHPAGPVRAIGFPHRQW